INGFSGQFSLGHAGFMAVGAYMAAYPAISLSHRLKDPVACLWFYLTLAILVGITGTALLLLFWGVRATRGIHSMAPWIVLLILLIWLLVDFSKATHYAAPPGQFVWTNLFAAVTHGFDRLLSIGQPMAA